MKVDILIRRAHRTHSRRWPYTRLAKNICYVALEDKIVHTVRLEYLRMHNWIAITVISVRVSVSEHIRDTQNRNMLR